MRIHVGTLSISISESEVKRRYKTKESFVSAQMSELSELPIDKEILQVKMEEVSEVIFPVKKEKVTK